MRAATRRSWLIALFAFGSVIVAPGCAGKDAANKSVRRPVSSIEEAERALADNETRLASLGIVTDTSPEDPAPPEPEPTASPGGDASLGDGGGGAESGGKRTPGRIVGDAVTTPHAPEPVDDLEEDDARGPVSRRCARICDIAESTCDLAEQICGLAESHSGSERYADACERAGEQCRAASSACDGCNAESP